LFEIAEETAATSQGLELSVLFLMDGKDTTSSHAPQKNTYLTIKQERYFIAQAQSIGVSQ
jgi:hypothetical protein